jgi:hypothetical protein
LAAKVSDGRADIQEMGKEIGDSSRKLRFCYSEAHAIALSVAVIRKAQGKKNPSDFSVDSAERLSVEEEFARDVLRVLDGRLDH